MYNYKEGREIPINSAKYTQYCSLAITSILVCRYHSLIHLSKGEVDLHILIQVDEVSMTLDWLLEVDHHGTIITLPSSIDQQSLHPHDMDVKRR